MRTKTRILLAAGCVSLLALSIPAYSRPATDGAAHAPKSRAVQQKNAKHLPKVQKPKHTARRAAPPADRQPANLAQHAFVSSKPTFGWPALVSEARKYMGTNPTSRSRLWCATFMNLVLAKVGYNGTHSDAAKSFASYGRRISEPRIGAIAVLSRGKRGGHVGVVSGIDPNGNPIIISGNHNKRVGEGVYPRSRVIAYVMPTEGQPAIQVADRGNNVSPPSSEGGLELPIAELIAAIEAEQNRPDGRAQPARAPEPPMPHRTVQQLPEPAQQAAQAPRRELPRDLPLDPVLAELFGIKEKAAQRAPLPRQQRAEEHSGRIASAENGRQPVR